MSRSLSRLVPLVLLLAGLVSFGCQPATGHSDPTPVGSPTAVVSSTSSASALPDTVKAAQLGSVPNVHVAGQIWSAGQPSPSDFEAIRDAGITSVVTFRHAAELGGFDERAVVDSVGLAFEELPWNGPAELTDEVFSRTRDLLRSAEGPTLLHCGSANRVGAVWIPFRVLDQGVDLEQAIIEARTIGMRTSEYEQIARDYITRQR